MLEELGDGAWRVGREGAARLLHMSGERLEAPNHYTDARLVEYMEQRHAQIYPAG